MIGFEIQNVGNGFYDMFRNPLFKSETEAKDYLFQYLELEKIKHKKNKETGNRLDIYAGKKGDRKVILMPTNRPTQLRDLTQVYVALENDYDVFDKRIAKNPDAPVEKILIVCMGSHHPRLADAFQHRILYPLDIQVIDIDFETFLKSVKEPSRALFSCGQKQDDGALDFGGEWLIIEKFIPRSLLQKCGYTEETMPDWRRFVSAVYIDFNFDVRKNVPHFTHFDIPNKNTLVQGQYQIPKDGGDAFIVKIVDLILEPSYFLVMSDTLEKEKINI